MKQLSDLIPDPAHLLAMDDEQLGMEILEVLQSWEKQPMYQQSRENFIGASLKDSILNKGYNRSDLEEEIGSSIGRSWDYLVRAGYLIQNRSFSSGVYKLGDKAHSMLQKPKNKRSVGNWKIIKEHLHHSLQISTWNNYRTADYETAVFSAMKAVEVAVRDAAVLPNSLVGVALMRKAFDSTTGALTDLSAEGGEKQAMSDLFAGSIGSFKNPSSHRSVHFENPDTAAEIILLANHLLRIVDVRKAAKP